jgi:hypothetical protein
MPKRMKSLQNALEQSRHLEPPKTHSAALALTMSQLEPQNAP